MSNPILLNTDCNLLDFLEEKIDSFAVVMFTADWCNPCKKLKEHIKKKLLKKATFVYVNVSECPNIAEEFGINGIPDVRYYISGEDKLKEGFQGGDTEQLEKDIAELRSEKGFSSNDFP